MLSISCQIGGRLSLNPPSYQHKIYSRAIPFQMHTFFASANCVLPALQTPLPQLYILLLHILITYFLISALDSWVVLAPLRVNEILQGKKSAT